MESIAPSPNRARRTAFPFRAVTGVALAISALLSGCSKERPKDARQQIVVQPDVSVKPSPVLNFPALPAHLQKHVALDTGETPYERRMIVIGWLHGQALLTTREEVPKWIAHQSDVLDALLALQELHGPDRTRYFFEGRQGPFSAWPENRKMRAPEAWKAIEEWKTASAERKEVIAENLFQRVQRTKDDQEAFHEWDLYNPSLAFVGHNAAQGQEVAVFGSEPPGARIPLYPPLDLDVPEAVYSRMLKEHVRWNLLSRNTYAVDLMDRTVPRCKVWILVIGAAHMESIAKKD